MSLYLRLVVGPVVICDVELFSSTDKPRQDDPPPQLNGGSGTLAYPEVEGPVIGFRPTGRPIANDSAPGSDPAVKVS